MRGHEQFMRRCLELARNGAGQVAPNPVVGAVLVQGERILAEGWHRAYGGPHAEVDCLSAFGDGPIPKDATLYVNLEPCSHHGKTPPCVDLVIARGIRRLVIGSGDPNPRVNGRGIARAREEGIEVISDVLRDECRWLNRRFICSHEKQRPHVVLKWARTADGFLDDHGRPMRISSPSTDVLVHRWRAEEQAILVGGRTVISDDPKLSVRLVEGRSPTRIILDRQANTPPDARAYDGTAPAIIVSALPTLPHRAHHIIHPPGLSLEQGIVRLLNDEIGDAAFMARYGLSSIASILVEGGGRVLNAFLRSDLWDEARVVTGSLSSGGGTQGPSIPGSPARSFVHGTDRIEVFHNGKAPDTQWPW